jgi:hypothetical protein
MTLGQIIKGILVIIVLGVLLFIGYWLFIFFSFGLFDSSSKEELIDNYKNNEKEISELKSYFTSITPKDCRVYIEFSGKRDIDLWVYETDRKNKAGGDIVLFQQWNINPYHYDEEAKTHYDSLEYSPKTKSLELVKQKLRWTDDTFEQIKTKLDRAECISVSSGEPTEIGFERSGMGKYSYVVFSNSISKNLITNYNDSCTYIFYKDKVVLKYEGGTIGSQCFPDK